MAELTILQVVPRLDTGGSEQATIEIAEALTRAGAKALVATAGGRMANAVTQAGGEIVTLPVASKNPFTMLANATRLESLIKERDVALVHARSRAPAWSALLAARRTGRPFVTTYHGAYGTLGPLKAAYNSVMGRGDRIIANSRYTARLIAERHRLKAETAIYRGRDERRPPRTGGEAEGTLGCFAGHQDRAASGQLTRFRRRSGRQSAAGRVPGRVPSLRFRRCK